jgi:hypothetical protein
MKEPTNGWQTMDSCPRLDYETYLVLVPGWEADHLAVRLALWDPEIGDFNVHMASWNPEPVYWQHLPCEPGETMKSDEERRRVYEEQMASLESEISEGNAQ